MNGMSANKKIILSIVGFILIIVAIVGVLVVVGKTSESSNSSAQESQQNGCVQDAAGDEYGNSSVNSEFNGDAVANTSSQNSTTSTTAAHVTNSPAMNVQIGGDEGKQIVAFISGKFYMTAEMQADGVAAEVDIAVDGNNFQTTFEMDDMGGMELGIMFLNDNMYIVNNNRKKYIDFKSFASMMGGQSEIDMSELNEITSVLDLSEYSFESVEQDDVDLNGQRARCYTYYANEITVCFYFVAGELRQVDYIEPTGEIITSISMKTFSPNIPSGMLSLNGMNKVIINEMNFMLSIIDFFGQEMFNQFMGDEFRY